MNITMLCEYMTNPVGVDHAAPLLTWFTDGESLADGARVTLRQAGCNTLLWDTGFIPDTGRLIYAGQPLQSGRTYLWQVTLRMGDAEYTSEEACITMGMLPDTPWQARWVGGIRIDAKCYMYRHEWIAKKPVRCAAAFVASLNYNVVTVNGQKPDNSVLNNTFADWVC